MLISMETPVFAAILVIIIIDITPQTACWNVRKFFSQMEPIWTTETTRNKPIKCVVDKVQSVKRLSISFKRCKFNRGNRCESGIYGVLDAESLDQMAIYHKDTFKRTENLLFMSFDQSCGVFKVQSLLEWDSVYFDLRLRNSSVSRIPHKACRNYFQRVIGNQRPMVVYRPDCQWLYLGKGSKKV
ncbi:uncharacterized protein LOC119185068 isoform X2 [Rhipicephalus microplus]|uniref:uncharacterized protein LOC119185068 isoform X2 n=1 Tax=Rhipicephalus microplus TaxID=6941 RepID=UPI002376C90A